MGLGGSPSGLRWRCWRAIARPLPFVGTVGMGAVSARTSRDHDTISAVTTPPQFIGLSLLSATMPVRHIEQVINDIRKRPSFISVSVRDIIGDQAWTRLRQVANVTLNHGDEGDFGTVEFADDHSTVNYPIDQEVMIVMAEESR